MPKGIWLGLGLGSGVSGQWEGSVGRVRVTVRVRDAEGHLLVFSGGVQRVLSKASPARVSSRPAWVPAC